MSDVTTRRVGPSSADHVRIYEDWHTFARAGLVAQLSQLYAVEATLETPLIPAILGKVDGICRGRDQILRFLTEGTRRRPNELVRWHRSADYLWNGRIISWEYPRAIPGGQQIDIAEYMDISDGHIQRHRIYWGWFGVRQLTDSAVAERGFEPHAYATTKQDSERKH
jgi:hypothetical protein